MKIKITFLCMLLAAFSLPVFATNIVVPNGDFTNTANDGSVGGGLLDLSGSSVIGSGPWSGTYNAVLGLLVPPSETIQDFSDGGQATISGIAGVHTVLGDVDNSGWFSVSIPSTTYMANTTYTLTADVETGSLLSASILDNFGAGIGLLSGSTLVASSTDQTNFVSVTLLSGSTYQVCLEYTTGNTPPTGNMGVELFDSPSGLANVNVLSEVEFSNVSLSSSSGSATPEPGSAFLIGLGLTGIGIASKKLKRIPGRARVAHSPARTWRPGAPIE